MPDEMEALLSSALDEAKSNGAQAAEAIFSKFSGLTLRVFRGEIETFERQVSSGIGVRVLMDGREGYAHTERLVRDAVGQAAQMAAENAGVIAPDEFALIEDYPDPPEAPPMYNPELPEIPLSNKMDLAKSMEQAAYDTDKRVINVPYAGYSEGEGTFAVANSAGLLRSTKGNYAAVYCVALAQEGESLQTGYKVLVSRDFDELVQSGVGKEAAERGAALLGAKPIQTGSYPVIFENRIFASMLAAFSGLFSGRAVQEGRSVLAGRIGEEIAGGDVSVLDDALLADGPVSRPFDSEGYPSARLPVIENGALKSFLHNTKTARRDGIASTGHASRGYSSTLGVQPSNFFLPGGETPQRELLSATEKALLIVEVEGLHSGVNAVNGDFSLGAKGFWLENGKNVRPVEGITVSSNFLDALKNMAARADDFKFNPPGGAACFGAPSVLIEGISVAGQ